MGASLSRQATNMDFVNFPEQLIVDEQALNTQNRNRKVSQTDSGYVSGRASSSGARTIDHNKPPRQQNVDDQEMVIGWRQVSICKLAKFGPRRGHFVQRSIRHVRCCGRPWLDEIQYNFVDDEADYDADDEETQEDPQSGDPWTLSERQSTTTDADTICSRCLDRLAVSVARMGLYDDMLKGAADGKRLSVNVKILQGLADQADQAAANTWRDKHRESDPGPTLPSRSPPPARRTASADVTRWRQPRLLRPDYVERADSSTYWVAPDWLEGGNLYGF